jgi:hypothetical protein
MQHLHKARPEARLPSNSHGSGGCEEDGDHHAIFPVLFVRMPFGLRNVGQSLQRMMDQVLAGLPFAFCYIDDILVASRTILCIRSIYDKFWSDCERQDWFSTSRSVLSCSPQWISWATKCQQTEPRLYRATSPPFRIFCSHQLSGSYRVSWG